MADYQLFSSAHLNNITVACFKCCGDPTTWAWYSNLVVPNGAIQLVDLDNQDWIAIGREPPEQPAGVVALQRLHSQQTRRQPSPTLNANIDMTDRQEVRLKQARIGRLAARERYADCRRLIREDDDQG